MLNPAPQSRDPIFRGGWQTVNRRKVTAQDLLALRWISEPQLSPDGTRVVFVQTEVASKPDAYRSHLWMGSLDGGTPHQFTFGEHSDSLPRWSPDGQWIAFLSDRGSTKAEDGAKKTKQIYLIPADGGEARPLTHGTRNPSDIVWSPDSKTLAFVGRPEVPERPDKSDVKVITRARYKFDGEGFWDGRYKHLFLIPLAGGDVRQLTEGDADHLDLAWSPDGRWIACIANRTPERDFTNVTDVWIVPVNGGPARRLTSSIGPCATPAWAPDGRSLAYFGHDNAFMGATNSQLWVVPLEGGSPTSLTAAYDRSLGHHISSDMRAHPKLGGPVWSASGTHLFFVIAEGATSQLGVIDVSAREGVRVLTTTRREIFGVTFDRTCQVAVIAVSDPITPGDLWKLRLTQAPSPQLAEEGRLTAVNQSLLDTVTLSTPERFVYPGADGWPIDGWVIRPVEVRDGHKYPTVLEIHGGPHFAYGESFFHEFQLLAAEGFAVVYTNPRGSQGYGQKFTAATRHDWGGKDCEDILRGLDTAIERFSFIDRDRLGVGGGSYGGFMTNWIIGHTDRFKAAVTMRSISNHLSQWGTSDLAFMKGSFEFPGEPWDHVTWYWEHSPLAYVGKITTPLLILHSEQDYRCPIGEGEQLFIALCKLRREVTMVRFPNETHDLSRNGQPDHRIERLRWIVRWFADHLGQRVPTVTREPVGTSGEDAV